MDRLGSRVPPILAGLAGLVWVWSELSPQRLGFPDTDDPAMSLRFLEANPAAWTLAGYSLAIAALALIPTVLAMGSRLRPEGPAQTSDLAAGTITVVGLMAAIPAAFLWLLLLGAWPSVNAAAGPVPAPAPGALAP